MARGLFSGDLFSGAVSEVAFIIPDQLCLLMCDLVQYPKLFGHLTLSGKGTHVVLKSLSFFVEFQDLLERVA